MALELKKHQIIPIEFMKNNRGIILYHSTGSGKTLTSLFSCAQFKYPIIVVGTKSSKKAFMDNITKAELSPNRFSFYTFAKIKKILEDNVTFFKGSSVIVDEAHNIRTENMYNLYISSALQFAEKIVLLTATPVVNYWNDLSVLINIIRGSDVLPTDRKLFEKMYYDEEKMQMVNKDILFDKIKNTVSYYKLDNLDDYPKSFTHYEEVVMSHEQITEYIYYIKKVIYEGITIVSEADILNIDYGLLPKKKRNHFLNVTRQLSNTVNNRIDSPKIEAITKKIKNGPFPVVIYSNFLKNGIYTEAVALEKENLKYQTITGSTSSDKLNLIVNNYNKGAYQVLLISSAGSESLDLKNTRQVHIMEPHWNESKIYQVIGRTIRYKSHSDLPPDERRVDIYRWVSTFPPRIKNLSADQYLVELSKTKQKLWDTYQEIVRESSIENNAMKNVSLPTSKEIIERSRKYDIPHGGKSNEFYHYKYLKYKKKYVERLASMT